MDIIELKDVTKKFKSFSVENVNLKVKQGFVTGFIGENGAGKSTTIKLMMNLLKPDSGITKKESALANLLLRFTVKRRFKNKF